MEKIQKRLLMLADNGYEDLEVWYPILRMSEEGFKVTVASMKRGRIFGRYALPCTVDAEIDLMEEADFDGLILPGAVSIDELRENRQVRKLTRQFFQAQKLVAFMDHAGWLAICAGIVRDHMCTSISSLRDDMHNAGAMWIDQPTVVDRNLVSARGPEDLSRFCRGMIEVLQGTPFPYRQLSLPQEDENLTQSLAEHR